MSITEKDIGEMIFRTDHAKNGKILRTYMVSQPPKVLLVDQSMLRRPPIFSVDDIGQIIIATENCKVAYQLCPTQLQEDAMTLKLAAIVKTWSAPPPEPKGTIQ